MCGTTSAIDIAFRVLCNPGDAILVERYTYTGTMSAAKAQGLHLLGIEMDDLGLLPDALDRVLRSWDYSEGRKSFVLYMVPTGQNPTGSTQTLERRKAIYDMMLPNDTTFKYSRTIPTTSPTGWHMHRVDRHTSRWTPGGRVLEDTPRLVSFYGYIWPRSPHGHDLQDSGPRPTVWLGHGLGSNH